ncbi:hypothetical protein SCA6_001958, partial [Theobroma cacao]
IVDVLMLDKSILKDKPIIQEESLQSLDWPPP